MFMSLSVLVDNQLEWVDDLLVIPSLTNWHEVLVNLEIDTCSCGGEGVFSKGSTLPSPKMMPSNVVFSIICFSILNMWGQPTILTVMIGPLN